MWPTTANSGPSPVPATRATVVPITSVETSANEDAASANTRAASFS
jgi:hypothetical protein